jgi:hypothetical protein
MATNIRVSAEKLIVEYVATYNDRFVSAVKLMVEYNDVVPPITVEYGPPLQVMN